jgi:hypothetical protein
MTAPHPTSCRHRRKRGRVIGAAALRRNKTLFNDVRFGCVPHHLAPLAVRSHVGIGGVGGAPRAAKGSSRSDTSTANAISISE